MSFFQRFVSGAWNSTPMTMFRRLCCNMGGFATAAIVSPFFKIIDEIACTNLSGAWNEIMSANRGYQVFFRITRAIFDRINRLYDWFENQGRWIWNNLCELVRIIKEATIASIKWLSRNLINRFNAQPINQM